jgi:small G protein signaling modulator 3
MSDTGSVLSRRSSSQTSHASSEGRKAKTVRGNTHRAGSRTSTVSQLEEDPSLTSFPSLEPDAEPSTGAQDLPAKPAVTRSTSQKVRDRKATLARLTSASAAVGSGGALFDDSPRSSFDVPGSLHLSNDDHIKRLIAKTGAVKLIRQYAQDLAQRDAEISALRVRADNRERELKRLLREADVPTAEIERRLLRLEQGEAADTASGGNRTSIDGLMGDAISTEMGLASPPLNEIGLPLGSVPQGPTARKSSAKASATSSRQSSRTNSILSIASQDLDQTVRPRAPGSNSNRMSGLQGIFQPPSQSSSYFIGGNKSLRKPKAADEVSVKSTQSSRSWTQIFGGKSSTRSRAMSVEQTTQSEAESALAKLSKTRTNPQQGPTRGGQSQGQSATLKARPVSKRTSTATRLSSSPGHARKDSNASLPLTVEMDSVLEPATLPPTMTTNNVDASGLLTDRFGFIYDQRRRKRQVLEVPKHKRNQMSVEIASMRSVEISPPKDDIVRSSTPLSIDDDSSKKSWQEYLKPAYYVGRPKELLSHTPSAGAVVTVSTADINGTVTPPRQRDTTITSSEAGLFPNKRSVSQAESTPVTATSEGFAIEDEMERSNDATPSRLLLEQLNDLHDSLQNERMAKWNNFLRMVRAERAINADPTSKNAPEADLLDGELIGIATLGRSTKQRAKYTHFKSLVLAGIPVALRPKVWAECSGATASRVPGYYEDLVLRSDENTDIDVDIATQIKADVRRTLTDNVFFQTGPGVSRLEQVLRAYSLHNPSIGYCQGMNLIAASLLLICATPEDCFWLLIAVIDTILPSGYFSGSLLTARADQIVLREYVTQLLPSLSSKLDDLGVELEACTFHWFLSLYAGVLTGGEALYRIWDIVLTLHSTEAMPTFNENNRANLSVDFPSLSLPGSSSAASAPPTPTTPAQADVSSSSPDAAHDGTSSPFLFQIALSLLYLNQNEILALDSPAAVYTYLNHNVTDHAVSVDALVQASEALGKKVRRADVLERRRAAVKSLGG